MYDCCTLLKRVYDVLLAHGIYIPPELHQPLLATYVGHVSKLRSAGHRPAPKHHWAWEMIRFIGYTGNPRLFSEYPDESFNCAIGRMSQAVHVNRFAIGVLLKYRAMCMATDRVL